MTEHARQRWLVPLLLCAAVAAIYAQVRHHEFVNYDDHVYVVENPNLRQPLDLDAVVRAFSEPYETNWIPLTWLSLHLDYTLFGVEPAGYLLENAALHALAAVLLYLALAGMTRERWPSAFVAGVFAVHPLHVESVAWAAERKDTLSGVFFMTALLCHGRYAARPGAGRYAAVVASGALGLLAKPMLVTLPLVLLLLDFWPLHRWRRVGALRLAMEKLPLLALAAGVAAVTVVVQRDAGAMSHDDLMPLALRVANALGAVFAYLRDSVWPTDLAVFYPHTLA